MKSPKSVIDGLMYDGAKVLAALELSGFCVVRSDAYRKLRLDFCCAGDRRMRQIEPNK